MNKLAIIFLLTISAFVQGDYTASLPPGFLPFEEFAKEFKLGETTTEQLHPITKTLSQTLHRDIEEGLNLLLDVDEIVIEGMEQFVPSIEKLAPFLADNMRNEGRVFLVGSGSSGRIGIDIAAKCTLAFPESKDRIFGVIAGGDAALIRAKEGFEDSEADGREALKGYDLGTKDTVILISASGSASFNVGCGHFSADQGANVFYFYNSVHIPSRTQRLFERAKNPVTPLCIDIGPQAIAGSTRLQVATLAEVGIGAILASALYLNRGSEALATAYPKLLIEKMKEGNALIQENVQQVAKFVEKERDIFSDPESNFRRLHDVTEQGYVTFIAYEDCMREVLIDATESSPTFSTNPMRRENEPHKKREEFRAYLFGKENNREAWKALLGRNATDTEQFLLAAEADGVNSYQNRPIGPGNFVIGVMKSLSYDLLEILKNVEREGGMVGTILLCRETLSEEQKQELSGIVLVFENVPDDVLGISQTVVLKQALNLISNGSMVLMNKIHGNRMIDVRAANRKLIDRCMRLIKDIWSETHTSLALSDNELYHYVAHVSVMKKTYEEKGIYTPSAVKIVLAMLSLQKTPEHFQEVVDFLMNRQENIEGL